MPIRLYLTGDQHARYLAIRSRKAAKGECTVRHARLGPPLSRRAEQVGLSVSALNLGIALERDTDIRVICGSRGQ